MKGMLYQSNSIFIKLTLALSFVLFTNGVFRVFGQNTIAIPDASFAAWLNDNIPAAMSGGNLMDTTHIDVTSRTSILIQSSGVNDLSGIQYFTSLITLNCNNFFASPSPNQLTNLPTLPNSLKTLNCSDNNLTSLPDLPVSLLDLVCENNQLSNLPDLPFTLKNLYCSSNLLTELPPLLDSLQYLFCGNNQLVSLPSLPASLTFLFCGNNLLTSLPALPNSLTYLDCTANYISCFSSFPSSITSLFIYDNPYNCLPNYIPAMSDTTLGYPLCLPGNSNGCASAVGIVGFTYKDLNNNCIKDSSDQILVNIPLKIYDSLNNLVQQTYSAINGIYNFEVLANSYTVIVDTTGMPFEMECTYPGLDSTVVVSDLETNINFSLKCKPGFDLGVQSVVNIGQVFPGQIHRLNVVAGNMPDWYNLNCNSGISGAVEISVTGPITFVSPAPGSLVPNVIGDVYTYNISNFDSVDNVSAFNLLFITDTIAQLGDEICVNVTIIPGLDNYTSNNTYSYCYPVVNSYDPNMKEAYPVNVLPGYDDWFIYTIHFQNTGDAPAINIRLADSLDATNLNLSTFQRINYSHPNEVSLVGNVLTIRFPNIYLPDSTSNSEGSKGFFQYRIKPKSNLPVGKLIENTAYIYFDYNSAIVTNTTQNIFTDNLPESSNYNSETLVFPNPFSDNAIFRILTDNVEGPFSFQLIDAYGKLAKELNGISDTQFQISRNGLESGIYFYRVSNTEGNIGFGKVIVQ